jgi:hypothetical protein
VAAGRRRSAITLDIHDLTSDQIIKFLQHLEDHRKNSARPETFGSQQFIPSFALLLKTFHLNLSIANAFLPFHSKGHARGQLNIWNIKRFRPCYQLSIARKMMAGAIMH